MIAIIDHTVGQPPACAGIRVLELGGGMASSLAGQLLADHGASVVKVEPPAGARERPTRGHPMWNRGKASLVLDLAQPDGRAQLTELAALADVVITSLQPTTARRLGVDPPALARLNPALVVGEISALGPLGPKSTQVRGYDAIVSALVGRMSEVDLLSGAVPGQHRAAPIFTAAPILAYGAAQLLVQGVLAALLGRRTSGCGEVVRTSLLQAWTVFMMRHPLLRTDESATGDVPAAMQRGLELCFMTARCSDGAYIQMCARQDAHFHAWLDALGLSDLRGEARFAGMPLGIATVDAVDELTGLIRARMATRTQAEWMQLFTEEFDVGADPFLTPHQFLAHPQLVANDRVLTLTDPAVGPVRQLGPLVALRDTPAEIRASAPALGSTSVASVTADWQRQTAAVSAGPQRPVDSSALPLTGVTVLEIAHFVAGPLAGSLLAELGARVIKVEPLGGDPFRRTGGQSIKYLLGKESIALNLKDPAALAIMDELIARSDVFVQNFRPDVPARLGLGYERLASLNPRLVYVNASAYGSAGPQRNRSAFHSTPTALSGAGILQAGRGNPPVDDSFPDPAGALAVATGILLALHARAATDRGQYVETTMLTSAGYVMSGDLVEYAGAPTVALPDAGQHGRGPLYRLYECADGWLFLAAARLRDRAALAGVLHRAGSSVPVEADGDELTSSLVAAFARRPAGDWVAELREADIAATIVTSTGSDTWLREQGLLSPGHDHPAFAPHWTLPAKINFAHRDTVIGRPAALGEHSEALLTELGYSAERCRELIGQGVLGIWDGRPA